MEEIDRLWDDISGNGSLKQLLLSDLASGRLAHAFILEGPKGSGKRMLALTVCAALADDSRAARLIFSDCAPDVQTVRRSGDRKSIGVDEIRALRASAFVLPCDLDFKAYLISDAETMTAQAQNALLKILEEPPQNVYFFLLCQSASALLPTVRSRAPTLRMQVFGREELRGILLKTDPEFRTLAARSPEESEALLDGAEGCIGRAKELLLHRNLQKSDLRTQAADFLDRVLFGDAKAVYPACLELPQKREEMSDFCDQVRLALRDMAAIRSTRTPPLLFGQEERLREMARHISLGKILQIEARFAAVTDALNANVNLQNAKISLASALCAIGR